MLEDDRLKGIVDLRVPSGTDPDFSVFYEIIDRVSLQTAAERSKQSGGVSWLQPLWLTNNSVQNPPPADLGTVDIEHLKLQLGKLYEPVRNQIRLALMELALFHPDDDSGLRFFSFLVGPPNSLKRYLDQIKANLYSRRDRVPLFPSKALYESPYFVKMYDIGQVAAELNLDETAVVLVEYAAGEDTDAEYAIVRNAIEITFDEVTAKVLPSGLDLHEEGHPHLSANLAVLIPILRPAAYQSVDRPTRDRIRGGGLFMYGERTGEWWHDRHPESRATGLSGPANFSLRSLHGLLYGIMGVSYSRVDEARRERMLSQAAYIAHGHEVRKFVSRIAGSSPHSMLALIRSYFTFMFAAADADSELSDYLMGLPFIHSQDVQEPFSLRGFVRTGYDVAGLLHGALQGIELANTTDAEEMFLKNVQSRLEFYRQRLDCNKTPNMRFSPSLRHKWAFFGCLVCIFRNVLEHADFRQPVTVEMTEDAKHLIVSNLRQAQNTSIEVTSKTWLGNTYDAAEHYAKQYRCEPPQKDSSDGWRFVTKIPIPESE